MAPFLKNLNAVARGTTLFREDRLKGYGLTGGQVKYLFAVCSGGGVSQDELARSLFVNKSNVARQMSALEEAGYVRREQSAGDKRVWRVYPTAKAEELMPVIRAVNEEWKARLCEGLTAAEEAALASVLDKLVANVRRYEEERG